MIEIVILALCLTITVMPPRLDVAIIIKEFQMGWINREKFMMRLKDSLLPTIALWASLTLLLWLLFQ